MAITHGYGDLPGYKQRFFGDTTDTTDDNFLEPIIEATSRLIDNITDRRFYGSDGEVRYYTPLDARMIFVDDLLAVDSIKTDGDGDRTYETTWDTGDYDLMPLNSSTDVAPYTWIEISILGNYTFPVMRASVELTGDFGYCTSTDQPTPITEALYLGAHRAAKRLATPLGVSGSPRTAQISVEVEALRFDPDFLEKIDPYTRKV